MPIVQRLENFDRLFHQLSQPPVIANDLANVTEEEREKVKNLVMTRYSGDMLSVLPSCQCGHLKGEFAREQICPECDTPVRSIIDEDIEPIVWFRAPEGVQAFINPTIWIMLKNRFKKSGYNIIQWLCDTTYAPRIRQPKVIQELQAAGLQRGFNNFIENFDDYMEVLFENKNLRLTGSRKKFDYLRDLLRTRRECVFSRFLPVPNRSLLIIEKSNVGVYVDPMIIGAKEAIDMLLSIDTAEQHLSLRTKENRAAKANNLLAEYVEEFFKKNLTGKQAIFRKHVFGSRTHFSFRTVITSLTGSHRYEEIHIPWGVGVTAFRPHLINKLLKRGFAHNQAIGFLNAHVTEFHPLLNELFNELLEEVGPKGIPCLAQRN